MKRFTFPNAFFVGRDFSRAPCGAALGPSFLVGGCRPARQSEPVLRGLRSLLVWTKTVAPPTEVNWINHGVTTRNQICPAGEPGKPKPPNNSACALGNTLNIGTSHPLSFPPTHHLATPGPLQSLTFIPSPSTSSQTYDFCCNQSRHKVEITICISP
jgi:hypothetical protein